MIEKYFYIYVNMAWHSEVRRVTLSYVLNSLLKVSFSLEELLSACPRDPPNTFHTYVNPPVTTVETRVCTTKREHRPLRVKGGKNHKTGTGKENMTLLLPNTVAKLSFLTPSLVLHPQKYLPSREGLLEQKELGCTEAAVGTAKRDNWEMV